MRHTIILLPHLVILSGIFLLTVFYFPAFSQDPKILPPGTTAPSFNLPDLAGNHISLNAFCGPARSMPLINKTRQIVILSFWATYCLPCAVEIPELEKFAKKHVNEPVKVLLVSIDEQGEDIVAPFVQRYNYTLPVLLDLYRKTAGRYGVKALPSLFVIDPEGVIRYSSSGYEKKVDLGKVLETAIQKIRSAGSGQTSVADSTRPPGTASSLKSGQLKRSAP